MEDFYNDPIARGGRIVDRQTERVNDASDRQRKAANEAPLIGGGPILGAFEWKYFEGMMYGRDRSIGQLTT